MSQYLDKLKAAEEQRLRVIAERRRFEDEADSALQAREREERVRLAGAEANRRPTPALAAPLRSARRGRQSMAWLAVTLGALTIALLLRQLLPGEEIRPSVPSAVPPVASVVQYELRLDRDAAAFAARARETAPE